MGYMSNFKIAFFTKVEYKENFRNKKSKQYIKCALPLNRIKHKTNSEQFFSFHPTSHLPTEA